MYAKLAITVRLLIVPNYTTKKLTEKILVELTQDLHVWSVTLSNIRYTLNQRLLSLQKTLVTLKQNNNQSSLNLNKHKKRLKDIRNIELMQDDLAAIIKCIDMINKSIMYGNNQLKQHLIELEWELYIQPAKLLLKPSYNNNVLNFKSNTPNQPPSPNKPPTPSDKQ